MTKENIVRLLPLLLIVSCMSSARGLDALRANEVQLAGEDAVDCGVTPLAESAAAVDACVVQAFEAKRPFIARYYQQGFDSEVIHSLVGNGRGEVFRIIYDSNICGEGNQGPGCRERITEVRCLSAEVVVEPNDIRRVDCRTE